MHTERGDKVIRFSISFEFELGRSHHHEGEDRDYSTTSESFTRLKRLVKKRDEGRCQYCGDLSPGGHIDHVIPLSRGGTDSIENLKWSCPTCNLSKGDKTLDEWHGAHGNHWQQSSQPVTLEINKVIEAEESTDVLDLYGVRLADFQVFAKAVLGGLPMSNHSWVGPSGLFSQGQFSTLMARLEQLEYVKRGIGNKPRKLTPLGRAVFAELVDSNERG